jgi:hypothetical protein
MQLLLNTHLAVLFDVNVMFPLLCHIYHTAILDSNI